jgi:2-(1,2-epoxy-1,2-dihydrophenyl)acetyl-CoA isomerase
MLQSRPPAQAGGHRQEDPPISDTILFVSADGVATLTLNRPEKLNAFTDEMLAALAEALKQAERDETVRCIVITGSGRAFSAGQDLASVRERDADGGMSFRDHLQHAYNPIIRRLRAMEKPVIAAVNGVAAGAGASLALACDLRLAAESASFIQAFIGVGLIPDNGATWFLPQMIGFPRAFELAVTGRRLTAAEALTLGLVNRVVADEALADAAGETAAQLAAAPTKAIGLTKRAMNRALLTTLDEALDYEAQLQEIAGRTADHREGVAAFLEKRPPRFEGR